MKKAAFIVMLLLAGSLRASEMDLHLAGDKHSPADSHHIALSHDARWAGVLVIISLGMFVMAAAIGAVGDMNHIDEPAADPHDHDDHSHDSHGHDPHAHDSHGH